ncbi:nodal homolog [Leptodactylus fuscus]|uniref:nodal homolog n=1 Tax=Leptodactylus fuscus TaxID=238119 RepID=UPI003F4E6CD2
MPLLFSCEAPFSCLIYMQIRKSARLMNLELRPNPGIHKMGERCVLVFDFSSLSHDEELQFAEIQMRSSVLEKSFGDGTQVMLDIFHQNSACEESNELCKKLVYLGEFESAIRSRASERFGPEPWIVENVTEMVSKWFEISKKSDVPPKKEKEKFPGLESAKKRYKEHISEDQQVMMFVYSNTSNKEKSLVTASLLLDAIQSKYLATMPTIKNITIPRRPRRSSMIKDRKMGVEQDPHVNTPSNLCRRVDFIVDFKMIGWDEWILHPKKFNAYRCEGKCPSPVNERVRPNNHSYLQSLVNYYNSKKAPEVCCVPTKMSNLSMAFLEQADMDVHVHEAMIVEECGCR